MLILEFLEAADARSGDHAESRGIAGAGLQPAVLECVERGADRKLGKPVHALSRTPIEVRSGIEIITFAAEPHRKSGHVKALNGPDAAFSGEILLPENVNRMSKRTDEAHARNYDAPLRHPILAFSGKNAVRTDSP